MDKLTKERTPLRSAFTKYANIINNELAKTDRIDLDVIETNLQLLQDKNTRLNDVQQKILNHVLDTAEQNDYDREFESGEQYVEKYLNLKKKFVILQRRAAAQANNIPANPNEPQTVTLTMPFQRRKLKLPPIDLPRFSGDIMEWLPYWSQFKKIDCDPDMPLEDKFQLLLQSMVPGSRAESLIKSFPPTGENYAVAVEQMKDRFARDEVLVRVYVRQLIQLVVTNASSGKLKGDNF